MHFLKLISFLLLIPALCFSMNIENPDSVLAQLQLMPNDTNKVKAINDFAYKTMREKPNQSLELCKQSLVLAKDLNFVQGQIKANNIIGICYLLLADYFNAEQYMLKALKTCESINDKEYASKVLNNLGALAIRTNNYEKAIEYNLKSLAICEENKDYSGMAKCYANIGINHKEAKNTDLAKEYLQKGCALSDSINDIQNKSICLNGLGSLYNNMGQYKKSSQHYKDAITLYLEIPDYYGLAISYGNISNNFISLNAYDSALIYIAKSNKYAHKINYQSQILNNHSSMATIYLKNKKFKTAEKFAMSAYDIALELNNKGQIRSILTELASIQSGLKNFEKAFHYLELSQAYSDSILTTEKQALILELDAKYDSERKQREIKLLQKEQQLHKEQLQSQAQLIKNQKLQFVLILLALLSVVTIAVIYYRNYKSKKLSNEQLKLQRNTIAKQNKKITDSIVYAQHIQAAILPEPSNISKILPESFLLFIPRDIVSGDFFWIKEQDNRIILAVVDCTGHGVPGAFMSILGTQLLNEISDFQSTPASILEELRQKLKIAMKQSDFLTSQRDGMDVGLCCIDKNKNTLSFAGANINLIHIKNDQINIVKANNQPVAIYLKESEFINHEIPFDKNDTFYITTDGLTDQFGGKQFEKYGSKRLHRLLKEQYTNKLPEQKHAVHTEFLTWKGEHEQIDDVTIFGFKCI